MPLKRFGLGGFGETDVASAATCDIGAASSLRVRITGTTTITSLGSGTNRIRFVRFSGALILTHSASLSLPTSANITTAPGDFCIAMSGPLAAWIVSFYQRSNGTALA